MKRHVAHHGEARRFEADDLQYYANIARLTAAESLRDPDKLHLAAQDSIAYAGISLIARRDSATVVPAWELACRMSVAVFEAALYQDHLPASIELSGGQFVTVTSRVSPHLVHAIDWVHAYALALSCRDQRALNVLCQVSAALLRESPTECDEFVFSLVEALRALHQGRHDVALALLETVLKTDPSSFHVAPAWAFDVALPFVDIVRRFIRDRSRRGATGGGVRWRADPRRRRPQSRGARDVPRRDGPRGRYAASSSTSNQVAPGVAKSMPSIW
jgi:hypothetical protein